MLRITARPAGVVALAALLLLGVTACAPEYHVPRLRIAAGTPGGVYHQLATALAASWSAQMGIQAPDVQSSRGSPDNLARLRSGDADIAFSAADAAVLAPGDGPRPMALARIYDDYLHVVVRADAPVTKLADLRGQRVSIGSPDSGVELIAKRLLDVVGLRVDSGRPDLTIEHLGLSDSAEAMRAGRIDAFFWSGGLPTSRISDLAKTTPIRLLDLGDVMPAAREKFPVYGTASIPASTYDLPGGPVTTLVVPNYLLVTDRMADDVAEALTRGLFDAQQALTAANPAALSIDVRSAIETAPIPLHPGALRYYRATKF